MIVLHPKGASDINNSHVNHCSYEIVPFNMTRLPIKMYLDIHAAHTGSMVTNCPVHFFTLVPWDFRWLNYASIERG